MLGMRGRPRCGVTVVVVGAFVLASCAGGGGQLAEQSEPTSTSTSITRAPNAPVPTHALDSPRTADATAAELDEVEAALRADDRDRASLAELGRRQQLAYRALSAHPEWVPRVEQAVSSDVRAAVRANVEAGASLAALTGSGGTLPSALPDWQVLAPLPASTLREHYREAEAATGIPWAYLAAIHFVESRMGRIHGTSSAGAQGPMQFIPETWASYGEGDITDDHDAIQAAARYLAARGGPDDMARALYAYNNDERYVAAIDAYARVMSADPRAYDGYHGWQVFYATGEVTYLLPEGYGTP